MPAFRTTRLKHVIEATGLQKRFGAVTALAGLDLFVEKGTILALLGPNGAGKTTAVSILTTLLRADAGTARIAGADVRNSPEQVRRLIGLSGQHTAVDGYLTGSDRGLAYPQRYRGGRSWVCAAILFSYALSWVMALVGLMVPSPEVINNASFMVVFPLTFVVNTFVPTESPPRIRGVESGVGGHAGCPRIVRQHSDWGTGSECLVVAESRDLHDYVGGGPHCHLRAALCRAIPQPQKRYYAKVTQGRSAALLRNHPQ